MMNLCCDVVKALEGKTLSTAESLTGGGIGAALTQVPGSSSVYRGGIISYTDDVKHALLGVDRLLLQEMGAVSGPVAQAMACGARAATGSDVAVSVTGLAGPGGDEYGNPVGTVFIGFSCSDTAFFREFHFSGNRDQIRNQTIEAALHLVLEQIQ